MLKSGAIPRTFCGQRLIGRPTEGSSIMIFGAPQRDSNYWPLLRTGERTSTRDMHTAATASEEMTGGYALPATLTRTKRLLGCPLQTFAGGFGRSPFAINDQSGTYGLQTKARPGHSRKRCARHPGRTHTGLPAPESHLFLASFRHASHVLPIASTRRLSN
jgi:hypothetical protein